MFCDKHKARVHTQYNKCRISKVKNPYHKSVCGVGCLGLMKDGSKPKTWENDEVLDAYLSVARSDVYRLEYVLKNTK